MLLDLDQLEVTARSLGFEHVRPTDEVLNVTLVDNIVLTFVNSPVSSDNSIGFESSDWHFHDVLWLSDQFGELIGWEPQDVLRGLKSGELRVLQRRLNRERVQLWIDTETVIAEQHVEGVEQIKVQP